MGISVNFATLLHYFF